jgi:flagellar assembly factor FliW
MSDDSSNIEQTLKVKSSRFGELEVAESSIILIPSGLIGFPRFTKFVMFEHKPPFSWLHSIEDENLAFVVVDGFEFGKEYDVRPPLNDKDCDFTSEDEFALLVVVTVRSDPRMTTVNLKAPVFVNMRNRTGVQIIIDDARFSTRHPLWSEDNAEDSQDEAKKESGDK